MLPCEVSTGVGAGPVPLLEVGLGPPAPPGHGSVAVTIGWWLAWRVSPLAGGVRGLGFRFGAWGLQWQDRPGPGHGRGDSRREGGAAPSWGSRAPHLVLISSASSPLPRGLSTSTPSPHRLVPCEAPGTSSRKPFSHHCSSATPSGPQPEEGHLGPDKPGLGAEVPSCFLGVWGGGSQKCRGGLAGSPRGEPLVLPAWLGAGLCSLSSEKWEKPVNNDKNHHHPPSSSQACVEEGALPGISRGRTPGWWARQASCVAPEPVPAPCPCGCPAGPCPLFWAPESEPLWAEGGHIPQLSGLPGAGRRGMSPGGWGLPCPTLPKRVK